MNRSTVLRVARPTDNLEKIAQMYMNGLGFERLYEFKNHEGFDGVILGMRSHPYHLEFTQCRGETAGKAPTKDNLLVFYIPDKSEWQHVCERMERVVQSSSGTDHGFLLRMIHMLEPKQFEVNEAWIVFRLNDRPVCTEADGDFNVLALMDAASCYIFGTEFVSIASREPSTEVSSRLFAYGQAKAGGFPETLLVPEKMGADILTAEAKRCDIEVVRVPDEQLLVFIGEARRGFEAYMRGDDPR